MSTPAFEIVGGWLRIQGHRIRMSTISRYGNHADEACWIYLQGESQGNAFYVDEQGHLNGTAYYTEGLAVALDAWFEAEAMDTYQREGG